MFGFDLISETSNETFNTSLDLAMFGDVGVRGMKGFKIYNKIPFFSLQIPVELPPIPKVDNDTLVMIIEQLLMLTLIIGRWMLPKVRSNKSYLQSCIYACSSLQGSMSRDELAQLLLTYIGTAADIIEFFDSFKV